MVRFVFKSACFLYHIHCYRGGVTTKNKTAPAVLPWSLFHPCKHRGVPRSMHKTAPAVLPWSLSHPCKHRGVPHSMHKTAPAVLPLSLSPPLQTPRCSTFNASHAAVTAVLPMSIPRAALYQRDSSLCWERGQGRGCIISPVGPGLCRPIGHFSLLTMPRL